MLLNQTLVFKIILVIVGGFIVFVGINVGFGGIQTLGWQVSPDFVSIADAASFKVQDSHVRFLGGLFGAMGVLILLASRNLAKYQAELRLIFIVMFVGGLARLSALQPEVLISSNIISSFLAEVLLMPILFFWLPRVIQKSDNK